MSQPTAQRQRYIVSVYEPEEANGALVFTLVPKGLQYARGPGGAPKRVPQFTVAVRQEEGGLAFDWSNSSDDPGPDREEMEADIAYRMKERESWINRVTALVNQVEQWTREMGWSTRRVDKRLDDTLVGKHRVPALLLQQDTCRVLLEPIGRSAADSGGLVDLYLMPAYDDIASLYYYDDRWNLHYNLALGTNTVVPAPKDEASPLSKETLEKVLTEMSRRAA